ncbi:MAG: 2-amino-4-hydroxy-6-hydroxymethyldihydropteridine diphosphokinase [Terriglobia bacterium]
MEHYLKTACLSLGSNLGDRAGYIERALAALAAAGVRVRRRSALYESEPVGMNPQRWFVNCLAEVETELMPLRLLRVLKRIERQLGRSSPHGIQPAARRIDIDIVYYGRRVVRMPELTIPHPRLAERRFVLEPLRELAPDWRHPVTSLTPAEMLAALEDHAAVRRLPRS